MDTTNLAMQPFTLAFKSAEVEGEFLGEVAKKRWPVLIFIFCFDVLCFLFRFTAKLTSTTGSSDGEKRGLTALSSIHSSWWQVYSAGKKQIAVVRQHWCNSSSCTLRQE